MKITLPVKKLGGITEVFLSLRICFYFHKPEEHKNPKNIGMCIHTKVECYQLVDSSASWTSRCVANPFKGFYVELLCWTNQICLHLFSVAKPQFALYPNNTYFENSSQVKTCCWPLRLSQIEQIQGYSGKKRLRTHFKAKHEKGVGTMFPPHYTPAQIE